MKFETTKIQKHGRGVCCYLRGSILEEVPLRKGDLVALRTSGRCVIIERIEVEELARIRRGARPGPPDAGNAEREARGGERAQEVRAQIEGTGNGEQGTGEGQ